jgi:hypothetical protein
MSGAGYEGTLSGSRPRNCAHHPQQRDRSGITGHIRGNTPAQRHQRGEQPATVLRRISMSLLLQFACQRFRHLPQLNEHGYSSQFLRVISRNLAGNEADGLPAMSNDAAAMREFCAGI